MLKYIKRFLSWLKRLFFEVKPEKAVEQKPIRIVEIKLMGQIWDAELVKENAKTIWVRLMDGNIINRHKIKHVVSM